MHIHASGRNYGAVVNGAPQIFNAIFTGAGGDVVVSVNPDGSNPVTFAATNVSSILPVFGRYIVSAPAGSVWLDW